VHDHFAIVRFKVLKQVVEVKNRYVMLSVNRTFNYSNQLPPENSSVFVHTCGQRMENVWTTGSYGNELRFHTVYSVMQYLYNL
jgi:hypothetical protein